MSSGRCCLREFEVFRLLAGGKSVGEIAAIMVLSPKTIANQYTRVKHKLEVKNMSVFYSEAPQSVWYWR